MNKSDTPRTDEVELERDDERGRREYVAPANFARQLERAEVKMLMSAIRRLEISTAVFVREEHNVAPSGANQDMNNPDVTEKQKTPAASTPASGSVRPVLVHVNRYQCMKCKHWQDNWKGPRLGYCCLLERVTRITSGCDKFEAQH